VFVLITIISFHNEHVYSPTRLCA